jgi:hypothetical protein
MPLIATSFKIQFLSPIHALHPITTIHAEIPPSCTTLEPDGTPAEAIQSNARKLR